MSSEEVIRDFLKDGFSVDHPSQNTLYEIFWARQPESQQGPLAARG